MNLSKTKIGTYSRLGSRKLRQKLGLFIAEGVKCVNDTLPFFQPEAIVSTDEKLLEEKKFEGLPIFSIDHSDMRKLSQLQTLPEVVAIYKMPSHSSIDKSLLNKSMTLMLDAVQDPGNLGTILRIASWFGIRQVVLGTGCADPYNPKAVQSSMGAIGMVRIIQTDLIPLIDSYPDIPVCGTMLEGKNIYHANLKLPAFVVMGNEGNGLSEEIRKRVNQPLLIPSFASGPHAESLNVAAATAITISEFLRNSIS
ncbi:MAG: RNA methyltransferase [Muribaculum sp.]|nr:RNA methyltransferase [Muribaculum sp.]